MHRSISIVHIYKPYIYKAAFTLFMFHSSHTSIFHLSFFIFHFVMFHVSFFMFHFSFFYLSFFMFHVFMFSCFEPSRSIFPTTIPSASPASSAALRSITRI